MMSKLSLVDELSSPPLSGSLRSRNKSRDVSRSYRCGSLSLSLMMSKLSLMDELSSPPLSGSLRSRNQSRDVSRSYRCGSLSLRDVMSKLSLVDELSSPPLSGSLRSRNKSRDVSRSYRCGSLSLSDVMSTGNMMETTVGKVRTWESLGQSSMVDVAIRCSPVSQDAGWAGQSAEGLQVVGKLGGHGTGQDQQDCSRHHHEKLPITVPM